MNENKIDCFVIMPIGDCDGYNSGHFTRVYEDIIKPAVSQAEFKPIRGDEVAKTNLIQLDILNKLLETPIAVCDLSSRNPNVLFELGIRQAFDMPVVLIQEKGTPKIFDINPLRYVEYSREMGYRDVVEAQKKIKSALIETYNSKDEQGNINSIVKLLALNTAASIPTVNGDNEAFKVNIIISQLSELSAKVDLLQNRVIDNSSYYNSDDEATLLNRKIKELDSEFTNMQVGNEVGFLEHGEYLNRLMKLKRDLYRIKSLFDQVPMEYTFLLRKIRQEIERLKEPD